MHISFFGGDFQGSQVDRQGSRVSGKIGNPSFLLKDKAGAHAVFQAGIAHAASCAAVAAYETNFWGGTRVTK